MIKSAERFICKLYKVPDCVVSADQARSFLFAKESTPETLPPTSGALKSIYERHTIRQEYGNKLIPKSLIFQHQSSMDGKGSKGN